MTNNTHFLRTEYTPEEKIERIHSSEITPGNTDLTNVLEEYDLDSDSLPNSNKGDFFQRVLSELDDEFDDFVDNLFEACGQEGDTFNLQIFTLPDDRNYDALTDSLEDLEGDRLDSSIPSVNNDLLLDTVVNGQGVIDLGFKTTEEIQDIEPSEDLQVEIERAETGETVASYGPEYVIRAPSQNLIEARVFLEKRFVAVTNSGQVTDGIQNDIVNALIELGDG